MSNIEIMNALRAHKEQITDVHAQYSALEAIVIGFMMAMKKRGTAPEIFEEAFEFAANLHIVNADINPGAQQTTQSLKIVEDLRKTVIPHNRSAK